MNDCLHHSILFQLHQIYFEYYHELSLISCEFHLLKIFRFNLKYFLNLKKKNFYIDFPNILDFACFHFVSSRHLRSLLKKQNKTK